MIWFFALLLLTSSFVHSMERLSDLQEESAPQRTLTKQEEQQFTLLQEICNGSIAYVKGTITRKKVDLDAVIPAHAEGVAKWALGMTPLYIALRVPNPIITTMLLDAQAKIHTSHHRDLPLLHLVVVNALAARDTHALNVQLQLAELLLAYGADLTAQEQKTDRKDTVFHIIARNLVFQNGGNASVLFDHMLTSICSNPVFFETTMAELKKTDKKNDENSVMQSCIDKLARIFALPNGKGKTALELACAKSCANKRHADNCKQHHFSRARLNQIFEM